MRKAGVLSILFVPVLLAVSSVVEAQQPKKVPRIGYLSLGSGLDVNPEAFRQGLRQLGYIEGQNIVVEWRFVGGKSEQYYDFAAEFARLKVDAIVTGSGDEPIIAAMNVTKTIPIIILTGSDPVARGFVASLTHPGGNVTGVSYMLHELNGKRLELLKEVVPKLLRVAILGDHDHQNYNVQLKELEMAALGLGLQLQPVQLRAADELENAFSAMARDRAGAFLVLSNPAIGFFRGKVVEFAAKARVPGIYATPAWVTAGGLMSYAPASADQYRRAAVYVDKILKGAKAGDLPIERPTKFELVINVKMAKQIGLTIPPNVLARADRVIK
jgi:putative tryptophan/tyrosine transport system substrate-binding protein